MRRTLATLVLAGMISSPLAAQSRIVTAVDTALVTVGDRITLSVTVEHTPGSQVVWPDSLDLAPFEVLGMQLDAPGETGAVARSTASLGLAAFELGRLEIPSFDVEVLGAGGEREALSTDRFVVEVVSVGADESGDIRDIRGPLGIPLGAWRIALWTLLPLLAVALLYTLARRLRAKNATKRTPALEPPEAPAHEIALAALAELEASPLLGRGEVKEYHIEVSDILRAYVERRFGVDALEMTTAEVVTGLRARNADADFIHGLRAFLDQCDLVKFAKVRPGPEASRQVLELGRRLVLQSAPRGAAEAAQVPAGAGASA
ncbi:MAG: hypothetical protein WEB90_01025 [Gemmatimonadota bacterium]